MKPTSLRLRSGTPVQFGVLTFLGSAALLTIPLRPLLSRIPPRPGLALSFVLFLVLRDVNKGFLGLAGVPLLYLPRNWYANTLSAGLGFPAPSFVSSDYFPLLPWLFLFWAGFYLYRLRPEPPPCRISACRGSALSGGAPSWSICCTSR